MKKNNNHGIVLQRKKEVMKLLSKGKTLSTIYDTISSEYNVTVSTIEKDLIECYATIKERFKKDFPAIVEKHVMLYDKIIEENLDSFTHETALKAMSQKEKLLKLHAPDTAIQINNNTLDLSHLTVEELQKLLNKGE